MISSESPVLENSTPGLTSGGEETWLRPRLRHRHRAKAAGNSYSLVPTAGRASPRLYKLSLGLDTMVDRCRRVVRERETTVDLAGKVVTQPPEPLPARSGSRKLSFVRNQEVVWKCVLGGDPRLDGGYLPAEWGCDLAAYAIIVLCFSLFPLQRAFVAHSGDLGLRAQCRTSSALL